MESQLFLTAAWVSLALNSCSIIMASSDLALGYTQNKTHAVHLMEHLVTNNAKGVSQHLPPHLQELPLEFSTLQ